MYRKIIKEKVKFKPNVKISKEAEDLIVQLLNKNPKQRLGNQADSLEILSHPWFEDLDWTQLLEKQIKAPFVPNTEGDAYIANFDDEFTREKASDSIVKVDLNMLKEFQKEFKDMNFNKDNV